MAGARHYTQLVCWQLADALRVEVFALTRRDPFRSDLRHRSQAEDAIDSVCRNIAEGFGCTSHREFARFLEFSRRSLNELQDSLRSARLKGYFAPEESAGIDGLARRLYPALNRLITYLRGRSDWSPHGST
ncbi:MAG: four helix bundle protein [Acidobacteria bacterium]|nr:four helix bundle protein [Acidobacteriota bacterium]